MAEDRPLQTSEEAIAALDAKFEDRYATLLARVSRKSVGDVELAFRSTPKDGTLFLQGQTVSRTTYAALWAWVQETGGVVTGGFTAGDGSTTFGLPDMRDRTIMGAGGGTTLGQAGGNATITLTTAQLPSHTHNVDVQDVGGHTHGGSTGIDSNAHTHPVFSHGGHNSGVTGGIGGGGGFSVATNTQEQNGGGNSGGPSASHTHGLSISSGGGHGHNVTQSSVGNGAAIDVRQPYRGMNLAIWY